MSPALLPSVWSHALQSVSFDRDVLHRVLVNLSSKVHWWRMLSKSTYWIGNPSRFLTSINHMADITFWSSMLCREPKLPGNIIPFHSRNVQYKIILLSCFGWILVKNWIKDWKYAVPDFLVLLLLLGNNTQGHSFFDYVI